LSTIRATERKERRKTKKRKKEKKKKKKRKSKSRKNLLLSPRDIQFHCWIPVNRDG